MCTNVVFEVPGCREGFAAVGVGTNKWTLTGVDPAVNVEVLRGVESFPAAGELAFARSVRDVNLLDVRAEVCREGE